MSITKRSKPLSPQGRNAHTSGAYPWYPPFKRAADLALAGFGFVSLLPLWLVISAAILMDDGPPIFFTHEVGGRWGRPFRLRKFRTMRKGNAIVADFAPGRDPRLTRVGRLLRPTALDELPVLLHILRGEMSFVGPRTLFLTVHDPSDPDQGKDSRLLPRASIRFSVRPGLTGLAAVYAAKNRPYREKFRYDALYVRKMNPWLDLKLLALSGVRTLARRWERVHHARQATQPDLTPPLTR